MRYQKGLKNLLFGGLNGLMPKQIIHAKSAQQFIPPTILASLTHYAEQQEWDYKKWFEDAGLDLAQVQQSNTADCLFVQEEKISH